MGADGHVFTIPVDRVPEKFRGLDPRLVGYERKELYGGDPFLWSYWDTNEATNVYMPGLGNDMYVTAKNVERWPDSTIMASYGVTHAWLDDHQNADLVSEFYFWTLANAEDWQVWT